MTNGDTLMSLSPYEMVGGAEAVRQIVDRFYDLMDGEPGYRRLRALHDRDLAPMRASLAGFLNAWLGGPRDWFLEHPGVCMMSAHATIAIDEDLADQWSSAMRGAIRDCGVEGELGERLADALSGVAHAMVNRRAVPAD